MATLRQRKRELPTIGWREWVALPDLGVEAVKAKVDTGARSSTLHAFDVREFDRDGEPWVHFTLHPVQRSTRETVEAEARLFDRRWVRSSTGHRVLRPVITTAACLGGKTWHIDLTLTNRDTMGFRMLLGRQAVRRRFLVDPGRSFLAASSPPVRLDERHDR